MQLPEIREEHERFIADLARYTNEVCKRKTILKNEPFLVQGSDTKGDETYRSGDEVSLHDGLDRFTIIIQME